MDRFLRNVGRLGVALAIAVAAPACRAEPTAPAAAPARPAVAPASAPRVAAAPSAPQPSLLADVPPPVEPIPNLDQVLAGFSRGWSLAEKKGGRLALATGCARSDRIEIRTDPDGVAIVRWDFGEAAATFAVVAAERIAGPPARVRLTVRPEEGSDVHDAVLELAHVDEKAGLARWSCPSGGIRLPAVGAWVSDDARKRYPVENVPCPKE